MHPAVSLAKCEPTSARGRATMPPPGDVAEWLGRGLQSLVQRFESARRLIGYRREPQASGRTVSIDRWRPEFYALARMVWLGGIVGAVVGLAVSILLTEVFFSNDRSGRSR
jgi:hypothetical protein